MTINIKKIKQLPQGVKASIAFFFASVISKGIVYITTPLYTRLLTTDEYGQVSVYTTWLNLFGIVAMFCLSYGVFNNGMIDYPEKRDDYSFSMLILSNIITVCFSALLLCLYPLIKSQLGLEPPLLILMCLSFLFQPAYNFWTARQRYELKYKMTVIWTILTGLLSTLISVIAIICTSDNRFYARIFGAEMTLIVIYIGFYIYLAVKNSFKINTCYWKSALIFNLPLIPHYLSTYLLGSSDKLMISYLIDDSATAYYTVAYSVAAIATTVWSAINSSLIPFTYEKCRDKNYKAISAITMPLLTVFAVVCILVIMLAPEVVAIMATADYMEAVYVIPPIIGGVFFQVQYFIYANIVYYYKRPKYVMYASVTSTVFNIVLNYLFIPKFGYAAAGYTTLICYMLQASIDYLALKKIVKEKVYNMRYLGILSLGVIITSLISAMIYDHTLIRYAVVLTSIILCIIFRNKIIGIIKTVRNK